MAAAEAELEPPIRAGDLVILTRNVGDGEALRRQAIWEVRGIEGEWLLCRPPGCPEGRLDVWLMRADCVKKPPPAPVKLHHGLTPPPEHATSEVVLPPYYKMFPIEPIRFGVENYGRGVLITKIVKYAMRAPFKEKLERDLAKAKRCLEMLTEFDRGNPDWWKDPNG